MTKYHAIPTTVDGFTFASKREAARYQQLKLMLRADLIAELQLQPEYKFTLGERTIFTYRADFRYRERIGDHLSDWVVEDAKGFRTPVYRLKKKLIEAQFGLTIRET